MTDKKMFLNTTSIQAFKDLGFIVPEESGTKNISTADAACAPDPDFDLIKSLLDKVFSTGADRDCTIFAGNNIKKEIMNRTGLSLQKTPDPPSLFAGMKIKIMPHFPPDYWHIEDDRGNILAARKGQKPPAGKEENP